MSGAGKSGHVGLVIGGEPRADLLPPELKQAAKGKTLRRGMAALVVLVLILVVAGYAAATYVTQQSQQQLDTANQRTSDLLSEQAKFVEVNQVTSLLAFAEAAREVGTSTEIDWKPLLAQVDALLPAGTTVTTLTADTGTPMAPFAPPTAPLQGDRIASITIDALTPTLPDVKAWLESLKSLDGYADAWPGVVTKVEDGYQLVMTIRVNQDVLAVGSLRDKMLESTEATPQQPDDAADTTDEDQ